MQSSRHTLRHTPPNATHLCQPLDVSVFRSIKGFWKSTLTEWRAEKNVGTISKDAFPKLLKSTLDKTSPTIVSNLQNGFRKCGIVPVSPHPILERLPRKMSQKEANSNVGSNLIEFLTPKEKVLQRKRRKLICTPAGQAIDASAAVDPVPSSSTDLVVDDPTLKPVEKRGQCRPKVAFKEPEPAPPTPNLRRSLRKSH